MGEKAILKRGVDRPTELLIVVILEAFAGVRYLLNVLLSLSAIASSPDFSWALYLLLMLVSFLLAYGLWHFAKWAWVIALALSILGVISTAPILLITYTSLDLLIAYVPSIALDLLTIALLLMKRLRGLFWGTRSSGDFAPAQAQPQNP